ncbi:CHAT domain-containing protein [Actinoplanes aureus]|uniref:CHAT domain-containing protein n=1 Tax=Actinoplanes aureus TaxID=2792083 RepID=A0A931CFS3_9ACTN|nr:CHAT domain-containing protein [Actinoplanes aureus]MBG0567814.1 CHAT domain-containing protein [Actinoplanes aureus]
MSEENEVYTRCTAIAHALERIGDLNTAISEFSRLPVDLPVRPVLAAGLVAAAFADIQTASDRRPQVTALVEIADADPPWPELRTAVEAWLAARRFDTTRGPTALQHAAVVCAAATEAVVTFLEGDGSEADPLDTDGLRDMTSDELIIHGAITTTSRPIRFLGPDLIDEDRAAAGGLARQIAELVSHGNLDAAIGELRAAPEDEPGRGSIAADLLSAALRVPGLLRLEKGTDLAYLIAVAESEFRDEPWWPSLRAHAGLISLLIRLPHLSGEEVMAAADELNRWAELVGDDPGARLLVNLVEMAIAWLGGDTTAAERFAATLPRDDPRMDAAAEVMATLALVARSAESVTQDEVARLAAAVDRMPNQRSKEELLSLLATLTAVVTEDEPASSWPFATYLGVADDDPAIRHLMAGMAATRGGLEEDPALIDRGVAELRAAIKAGSPDDSMALLRTTGLAIGLMRRHETGGAIADLHEARQLLDSARHSAGGPEHPQYSLISEMLQAVEGRLDAANRAGIRSAKEGLSRHISALLPGISADGLQQVESDALAMARQSLRDGDATDALQVLEISRELTLAAASARRPEETAPELAPGEISKALTDLDVDAMVHLMPGHDDEPGYAVMTPAAGPPEFLALPRLVAGQVPDGELPRWVWNAAVGPLVNLWLPRRDRSADRPARLVLVPMGELAGLPWQAARSPSGRYALEDLAISLAPSARALCRTASLSPVAVSPTGLVIGPAGNDEPQHAWGSAAEAYAIRQSFYPGARYLGLRPDGTVSPSGAGTAVELLTWLTTETPTAGSVAHLAVQTGSNGGPHLRMAGGERLAADVVTSRMQAAADRRLGLVVVSHGGDGGALATAFLAGGARTVVAAQHSPPDAAAALLLFMFHRGIRVEKLPAWAALHRAQRWMLNPERTIPADLPRPLAAALAEVDGTDPGAWAAFVHWGQ